MIDYLTFIEELKGLKKKALNPETRNITLEFNKSTSILQIYYPNIFYNN